MAPIHWTSDTFTEAAFGWDHADEVCGEGGAVLALLDDAGVAGGVFLDDLDEGAASEASPRVSNPRRWSVALHRRGGHGLTSAPAEPAGHEPHGSGSSRDSESGRGSSSTSCMEPRPL